MSVHDDEVGGRLRKRLEGVIAGVYSSRPRPCSPRAGDLRKIEDTKSLLIAQLRQEPGFKLVWQKTGATQRILEGGITNSPSRART